MGLNNPGITAKGDSTEARWRPYVSFPDLKASWPFTWSGCRDPTPGKQAVHTVDHIPSRCQLRSWGPCFKNIALKGATDIVPLGVGSHFTLATQSCLKHTRTAQGWGSMILIFLVSDKSLFFEDGLHFENSSKSLRFGVEIITVGNTILCFLKKKKNLLTVSKVIRPFFFFWWDLLTFFGEIYWQGGSPLCNSKYIPKLHHGSGCPKGAALKGSTRKNVRIWIQLFTTQVYSMLFQHSCALREAPTNWVHPTSWHFPTHWPACLLVASRFKKHLSKQYIL